MISFGTAVSSISLAATGAGSEAAQAIPFERNLSNFWTKGLLGIVGSEGGLHAAWLIAAVLFCAALGYLLGSINSAALISRAFYHDDVRKHGSGNAGATNMSRTFGKKAGIATLVCDLMKAIITVVIARFLCGEVLAYLGAMFCAFGHAFPCFYKFKGGKCVAVTAASVLMLEPIAFLIAFAIFALIVGLTKYVSLGSIAAALLLPMAVYNIQNIKAGFCDARIVFLLITCVLVIVLHKDNIIRLREGKEKKFSFGKKKEVPEDSK